MLKQTMGLILCLVSALSLAAAQQPVLLTGPAEPGVYVAGPIMAGGDTVASTTRFADSTLSDGKATFSTAPKITYAYWQGQRSPEMLIDLQRMCQIERVRINLLNNGPHGTDAIQVFVKGDPLEFPDNLKVGEIKPAVNGWNELPVGKLADGLRLVFKAQDGKNFVTLSEIEVWGTPAPEQAGKASVAGATSPKRSNEGVTWWAFDFGPAGSPSFGQFFVADEKCVYDRTRGFGWTPYKDGQIAVESNFGPASQAVPGLSQRDRGAGKRSCSADNLYRDFVMTSEYYHTQVRQTFALDVPNGKYRVMTMHGDIEYGRPGKQNFWIEAEGRKAVEEIVLPNTLCGDVVFDATVQDGQLNLTFDAASPEPAQRGFILNGLVVVPVNTAQEQAFADKRVTLVRDALKREKDEYFARTFKLIPYVETATMVQPSAEDQQRGFVAWTPQWMTLIYPNSVPTAEAVKRPLTAFVTPGEYEPVAVAMRTLQPLKGVACQVGDLQGPSGSKIPAAAWDIRTVKCWPQRLGSSWSTEYQVMPELLEPAAPLDLAADTTQEFWLTVKAPKDAKPGEYRAPVTVKSADGKQWQTTLRLTVLPFALAESERPVGMYWYDDHVKGEALDKQVRDMVEHGMRAVTINLAPKITAVDGKLVVDTSEMRTLLQHLRKLGLRGPVPHNCNFTSAIKRALPEAKLEDAYPQVVAALEKVSNDPTALKLLYYPVDEIGNDDKRGQVARDLCALIAKVPGATSYITVNNYASGEKWGDTFDIWCGNVDYAPDQEAKLLAQPKRYMRYGSSYVNDCRRARNNCGLGFYKRPAEAMYFWHYQCYNGDPFNDLDGDARDWCAAYPGPDGTPIPTMDWESHREGIDDMRYIATLKQLAAKAAKGTAAQKKASATALAELQAVMDTDNCITQTRWAESLSHEEYNNLRWRLAQQIVALQKALAK
jgi:hypothetical protein